MCSNFVAEALDSFILKAKPVNTCCIKYFGDRQIFRLTNFAGIFCKNTGTRLGSIFGTRVKFDMLCDKIS